MVSHSKISGYLLEIADEFLTIEAKIVRDLF